MTDESVPNVISLKGDPIYQGAPDKELLDQMEKWTEKVRSGEVVGVALAVVHRDDASGWMICGARNTTLVGECFGLARRICEELTK